MGDDRIKAFLRKRLTLANDTAPIWKSETYDTNYCNLLELLKRTCVNGESNSVLIIGTRGAGKTFFVNSVMKELMNNKLARDNVIPVHLNGFLHTDDRASLKEITRQLQLENVLGDKIFGSFQENLLFLLDSFNTDIHNAKSVIFILEEFDLFCHHRNQTLLYNLFDMAQSPRTPLAVVGLTSRLDVTELMEKRVKSRFSCRTIHILPTYSFDQYLNLCCDLLLVPDEITTKDAAKRWNTNIKELFKNETVQNVMQQVHNTTKDLHTLKTLLFSTICLAEEPTAGLLVDAFRLLNHDSKTAMLAGLSVLEICLIIAMNHLTEKYEGEPFNFQMIHHELLKFVNNHSSLQKFDSPVVMKAFEHLLELEFIKPVVMSSKAQKEYQMVELLLDSSQISETLQCYPNLPTEVQQWACRSII